jgi:N-methylhydantoinase B
MRARVAALRVTHRRIGELIESYGVATFRDVGEGIIEYVERVVRARLREIPDGSWVARGHHDHDGNTDAVYPICARLTKRGDELEVDMAGTAAQAPGPINCARPALEGVIVGVMLTLLCYDLPWAIGALRAIVRIEAQDGSLVSARSPAPVSMASIMAALSAQDVVANAFAQMLECSERHRREAQASWSPGICGGTVAASPPGGQAQIALLSESFSGGGGARTFADGIDSGGVFHSMGSRIANVEALESRGPLLELYRRQAIDAGGAGRFRGGTGLRYAVTPHKLNGSARLITRSSGVTVPAGQGLSGGRPGAPVSAIVLRGSNVAELFASGRMPTAESELHADETLVLAAKALTPIAEGDVLIGASPGGAGYGDPLRREAAAVARDVAAGLVSEHGASEVYGVVIGDVAATERTRADLRAARITAAGPTAEPDGGAAVSAVHVVAAGAPPVDGHGQGSPPASDAAVAGTAHIAAAKPAAEGQAQARQPVSDTIAATTTSLTCTVCNHTLGPHDADQNTIGTTRDLPLRSLGEAFVHCQPDFILRERACPTCGTLFAATVQPAGAPSPPGTALHGGSPQATERSLEAV